MTLRIGWYTTARGLGSRGMFEAVRDAIATGSLDALFAYVFVNREPAEDALTDGFFNLVREAEVPLLTLSSVAFRRAMHGERSSPDGPLPPWREAFDAEVSALVEPYHADISVLAGYMLIFTAPFVEAHPVLNLHPALPDGPTGTWTAVIRTLIREGARESGAMVHLAIAEVDAGPVAAFSRYAIRGPGWDALWEALGDADGLDDREIESSALFARIRQVQVAYEAPTLVAALQAFADGRLHVNGTRIVDLEGDDAPPLDLTADVEARIHER
jgi:folate-dependent phosphoribosylglycinamide formyltransferase PurN